MKKLHESFAPGLALSEATADPDTGVISDVKLLGSVSENGRRYTQEAMREGVRKYDGLPVYVGHSKTGSTDRGFHDLVARARNARFKESKSGIFGDVEIIDQGDTGRKLVEVARRAPDLVGLSHEARGKVERGRDGNDRVTEISSVDALALVLDPASTSGLHESAEVVELLEHIQEDAMDLRDPDREPDVYDYHLREQRRQKAERRAEHDDPRQADLGKVAQGLFGQSAEVLEEEDLAEVEMNLFV